MKDGDVGKGSKLLQKAKYILRERPENYVMSIGLINQYRALVGPEQSKWIDKRNLEDGDERKRVIYQIQTNLETRVN